MRSDPKTPLEECLASGDPGRWLSEHPEHRETLAPYLDLERVLLSARPTEGSEQAGWEARQRMLAAVTRPQPGLLRAVPSPLLRMGTVAAALALFVAATVGAGAFFSGVNPVEDALSAVNIVGSDDEQPDSEGTDTEVVQEGGIDNAPADADNGRQHASENASEGSSNSDQGIGNAPADADNGRQHASENASEGSDNSDQGIGDAPAAADNADNERDHSDEDISEDSEHPSDEDVDEGQDVDDVSEGDKGKNSDEDHGEDFDEDEDGD